MTPVFSFIYLVMVIVLVTLFVAGVFIPPMWFVYFLCGWFVVDAFVKFMVSAVSND